MEFKKQKSIYLQIVDTLYNRILADEWPEGERLISIRDLAAQMGVNPNTVQRSFDQLQAGEIIFNRRGIGYFVAEDAKEKIKEIQRKEFLEEELPAVMEKIRLLGLDIELVQHH